MDKTAINAEIATLRTKIAELETSMSVFDDQLENNQYESHESAERVIFNRYENIAGEACEGSYCCGASEYKQQYQISGNPAVFEATVSFEYNRHDKTYYYIDDSDYSYKEVTEQPI